MLGWVRRWGDIWVFLATTQTFLLFRLFGGTLTIFQVSTFSETLLSPLGWVWVTIW